MKEKTCILFCRCGANVISGDKSNEIESLIKRLDTRVFELSDLCAFSVKDKDFLADVIKNFTRRIVIACYPRAVKNMILQAGFEYNGFETISFKDYSAGQIFQKIKEISDIDDGEAEYDILKSELNVPAWYPVVDKSLCILCGKCARFCLFGVYSFNGKSLEVINPLACKNNCPACGRTCPTSAIIFPRMVEKTTLAGAEPGTSGKVDGEGDLLVMLNERNLSRRSIFRNNLVQQAEDERRKALEELKHALNKKK